MKNETQRTKDWKRGVLAAADIANNYNGSTTHDWQLGDCIALKLNVVGRKRPRRNKKKLQKPEDALAQGMVVALAEMHRGGGDSTGVCEVARAAGIDMKVARACGADGYDWKELRRAGVK